jgi:hypothetical protein
VSAFFTVGVKDFAEGSAASPIGAADGISSSGLDRCDPADPRTKGDDDDPIGTSDDRRNDPGLRRGTLLAALAHGTPACGHRFRRLSALTKARPANPVRRETRARSLASARSLAISSSFGAVPASRGAAAAAGLRRRRGRLVPGRIEVAWSGSRDPSPAHSARATVS